MIKVYSDCLTHKLFSKIPFKKKYTKKDVDNLIANSLFCKGSTLSEIESVFMIKCRMIDLTDCDGHKSKASKFISEYNYNKTLYTQRIFNGDTNELERVNHEQ